MGKQNHKTKISDEEFIEVFNKYNHIGKIANALKLPHVTVWRRLHVLGLKTNKTGLGKKIPLEEILEGLHPHYQTYKLRNRLIAEEILSYECNICKINEWNNEEISLQLDHIDGDSSNHNKSNLRLLCPNCHSQTNTWCGKNKK